jgi:nicotinate-nucleotide adenylyltransferase
LIGLLGGTFDPVHNGHIAAAEAACRCLDVRQIRLVLARQPYHKTRYDGATTGQRWDMLVLACRDLPHLVADDSELRLEGPSYTVDLLEQRAAEHPEERRCWIIGSDAFAPILGWRRVEDVFRLTNFLVFDRAGSRAAFDEALLSFIAPRRVATIAGEDHGQVMIVNADLPEVSSSRVRQALRAGEPVDAWLQPAVLDYIRKHHIYA